MCKEFAYLIDTISHEADFLPLLRKDDLKTPLKIAKQQVESIRQVRINRVLKASQFSLPIGYIVTSVPCTYKKSKGTRRLVHVPLLEKPRLMQNLTAAPRKSLMLLYYGLRVNGFE